MITLAKREFEAGHQTVSEIMQESGVSDIKTFRAAFKKFTGLLPSEYAKMRLQKNSMLY